MALTKEQREKAQKRAAKKQAKAPAPAPVKKAKNSSEKESSGKGVKILVGALAAAVLAGGGVAAFAMFGPEEEQPVAQVVAPELAQKRDDLAQKYRAIPDPNFAYQITDLCSGAIAVPSVEGGVRALGEEIAVKATCEAGEVTLVNSETGEELERVDGGAASDLQEAPPEDTPPVETGP